MSRGPVTEISKLLNQNKELQEKITELEKELSYLRSQTRTIRGLVAHKDKRVENAKVQIKVVDKPTIKVVKTSTDNLGMFVHSFSVTEIDDDDEIEIKVLKRGFRECCETIIGLSAVKSVEFDLRIRDDVQEEVNANEKRD